MKKMLNKWQRRWRKLKPKKAKDTVTQIIHLMNIERLKLGYRQ